MNNNVMYNLNNFGNNLRYQRTKNGYTIESFAELIDVSDRMVRYWEAGDNYPKLSTLLDICVILEISLESILQS